MVLTVNFDGSGSTGGDTETITSYSWDFGDGSTGSGVTASHTYAALGDYNVTLTVVNSCGNSNALTQCIRAQPELCDWIDSKGGPSGLTIPHLYALGDSYIFSTPPAGFSFVPTVPHLYGVGDYYLGLDADGITGCNYY